MEGTDQEGTPAPLPTALKLEMLQKHLDLSVDMASFIRSPSAATEFHLLSLKMAKMILDDVIASM